MKKLLVVLLLLAGTFNIEAKVLRADTIIVNGTKFLFVKSTRITDDYPDKLDTILKVYRIENEVRKYLLTHTLYTWSGDCNSVFEDHGSYIIQNDSIIFTTEFEVERDKNFGLPYQQKQIYIVKDDGKMILVYDRSEMEDGVWKDNLKEE
jgi:hypothetical protein